MIARLAIALSLVACAGEQRACPTTPAANATSKDVVTHMMDDMWGKRDPDAALRYFAPDLVNHAAIARAQGADGMRTLVKKLLAAYPDMTMHVEDLVADGDRVVVRAVMEGTNLAALEFQTPIPATGKHLKIEQIVVFRVKGATIVESWMQMDHLDMMKQLGLLPPPAAPTSSAGLR